MNFKNDAAFASKMDAGDPLKEIRNKFHFPQREGKPVLYFCGNSLGLQPKEAEKIILQELEDWKKYGVEGHLFARNPWVSYDEIFKSSLALITGARTHEVAAMNTLTVNLHLMMVSFYRPTKKRYKILIEGGAFPSDQYAVETQARFHGFDPKNAIIELNADSGHCPDTKEITDIIHEHGDELALVLLGGVNYYTGQLFDMEKITKAAHEVGAIAGFDLAHAIGNVPLKLHDWNVDFAVWCTYKYLNSGPGSVGGVFVHGRFAQSPDLPRFAGWWGYPSETRFDMKKGFTPSYGASGWQLSNAQIFAMAAHKASLNIFEAVGMEAIRAKSIELTAYLEFILNELIEKYADKGLRILTPRDPEQRGAQLSLYIGKNSDILFKRLTEAAVIVDWRRPDVIRFSPAPLYNSFEDVYRLGQALDRQLAEL